MRLHVLPPSPNAIKVLAARAPSRAPVRSRLRRSLQGGAADAGLHRAEPEPEDARPRGRRLRALGVERDPPVPRREAARRAASGRPSRRRQADVARWQFWQTAHWGPTCGTYVFERVVKRLAELGPANEAEVDEDRARLPQVRRRAERSAARQALGDRRPPDRRRFRDRGVDGLRRGRAASRSSAIPRSRAGTAGPRRACPPGSARRHPSEPRSRKRSERWNVHGWYREPTG